MTDFKLSCCQLLERYPLHHYRVLSETGRASLSVLLVGSGPHMETILHQVLCGGQLLDTTLRVIVVDPLAAAAADALLQRAPDLGRSVSVFQDGQPLTAPDGPVLAELRFETADLHPEAMLDVLLSWPECTYVIISTGESGQNQALADVCLQLAAAPGTLIGYVDGEELVADARCIGADRGDSYHESLENIAFNLHYAYAKTWNERETFDQILLDFQLPYNYTANMQAAIHIREKLACCGIETQDPKQAAAQFMRLMEERPELVERLTALEHHRWMMDKLLQGYRQAEHCDLFYSGPGVTTHSDAEKWHCCLVPCDDTGKSRLTAADWRAEQPRPELDPLDRLSLQVHRKCGELAQANRPQIDELLHAIRSASPALQREETSHQLELAVCQMWQQKRSAIPLYRRELQTLRTAAGGKAVLLARLLDQLETALAPLEEYISFKDYKSSARLMIRMIPFALTHQKKPVLLKVMAEQEAVSLFSAWQLEPDALVLLGCASSIAELTRLRARADNISCFLTSSHMPLMPAYHIFVPEHMDGVRKSERGLFRGWNCALHPVANWTLDGLTEALTQALASIHGSYLDVTGGEPLLASAAQAYARRAGMPVFYSRDGKLRDLWNAQEVVYPAPAKGITVREMFALSGAVLEDSESGKLTDLSTQYRALWKTAWSIPHWALFCTSIAQAYRNALKQASAPLYVRDMSLEGEHSEEYGQALKAMAEEGFLHDLVIDGRDERCSFQLASKEILACIQLSGTVLEYYIYYSALLDGHFDDVEMGWQFLHSSGDGSARNEIDVICTKGMTSLFISAKMLGLSQLVGKRANNHLNYILYEISLLADRFGLHAKPVLAAPAVEQFQTNPETGLRELSNTVKAALTRGVYLLGKECFQQDAIGQILDRIAAGQEDWCQFLR